MPIELRPLSEHTGVEALGVDLTRPLSVADRQALNRAFSRHSVLVIREQSLSAPQMLAAVEQFGSVFHQHNTRFSLPQCPEIHYVSNKDRYPDGRRYIPGAGYHTDHSNAAEPPKATVLHAVELPSRGGDTQFVNMHSAYSSLPDRLRARIEGKRGIHVYQSKYSERKLMALPTRRETEIPAAVSHPLVRTHPETGRKAVYLNPIRIEQIEGMSETDSQALLDEVLSHCVADAHQYRHRWQPGDLVMWDNRCLLHKANADYDMSQTRYLYRVMLSGDVPY